ncbi:MAG TPA: glycosyltransferase family 39 protein [Candidatus Acidoferrales bacterium]|nr:glycosyltransferase family 39 protein [Candidatus Acidoferrales bacterium]
MFVNRVIQFISSKKVASVLTYCIFLIIILCLGYVFTRGFIIDDEGWILSPAQRILDGQLPYRDFHFIYTPGLIYIIAIGFKLIGVSFNSARLITMGFSLLTVYILYKISNTISNSKSVFAYLIPVLLFVVWGPMHVNFAWPVMYTLWSGILTVLLLLISKKNSKLYFIAGVTTGLTILFKQNFGVALLLNNLIFFFFEKNAQKKKFIVAHIFGICMFPMVMVVYFAFTNTFIPFVNDMYYFMIQQIILQGNQNTPFIYPGVWYKQIVKTLFYLSPLLVSLYAVWLAFKKNKKIIFLASFTALYYMIGIRPTTDYVHLVPLLSIIGVPLLVILVLNNNKYIKIVSFSFFIILFILGFYTALFSNYYRWYTPLIQQNIYTQNPKLGILTDQKTHELLAGIDNYIDKYPVSNNYLFVDSFSPSFYLVTDKRNPTKFIFFSGQIFTKDVQTEMIQEIKVKNTPLVIANKSIYVNKDLLSKYIIAHYHVEKKIDDYLILVK